VSAGGDGLLTNLCHRIAHNSHPTEAPEKYTPI
jgi:hypothetical protein